MEAVAETTVAAGPGKKTMGAVKRRLILYTSLVLLLCVLSLAAPYLAPNDPYETDFLNAQKPPSAQFPCGTDKLGRCLFSRILVGAGPTILSALALTLIVFVLGTLVGVISGYIGGKVDNVFMRVVDIFLSFPDTVLALAVVGILGTGMVNAVFALAAIGWTKFARLARSQVLSMREDVFIQSAQLAGNGPLRIMLFHVLPNVLGTLVVTAALDVGTSMMNLAGISFLGLGAQPPMAEWGSMMNEGRSLLQTAPWMVFFPGIAIFVAVMLFNLFGDSVRDFLDPRQAD